jgi:hypothetical protein
MVIEELRTSSVVRARVELVIEAEPAVVVVPGVRVGLVAPEDPAVRAALVAQEDLVVPAVPAALVVQDNPVVPAAQADPAAPVVPENPVVPVVLEGPAALVVPENPVGQEDPVAPVVPESPVVQEDPVVPELDPVAVPLRIKSAIAARHRGLVPVPKRVEDLAAAAETTREQAATEVAAAWAVAV